MNESINHGGDCRTAPATPGLLNRVDRYGSKDSKSRRTSKWNDRLNQGL